LTKLKQELEWLGEVNSQALQAALRNLDNVYTRFFRERKGFPKFKKKIGRQSFQCPQKSEVDFDNNIISLIKIKNIKAKLHRKFKGKIKTVTISRTTTGKYFASVLVETPDVPKKTKKPNIEKAIGVDLGLKHFITLDIGEKVNNPKHLQQSSDKLVLLSRRVSRKTYIRFHLRNNWEFFKSFVC
jgi:putative transposase